jgi:hypothetical protein
MGLKTATESTGRERRRHDRVDVAAAILVSPNGHPHETTIYDVSEGGARIGLPRHFEHGVGALVRLHFHRETGPMIIFAEIRRMAVDHLGVQFAEGQLGLVNQLMDDLVEK